MGGFIFGTIVFIGLLIYPTLNPSSALVKPGKRLHPSPNSNTLGDPNAPVEIIEYADFLCSHCTDYWRETEPKLIEEYVSTGKASYTFKTFIPSMNQDSQWAAESVYCAGDQGKFWEMRDILFANYVFGINNSFSENTLASMAKIAGADAEVFSACLSQHKYQERVNQDIADGKSMGVDATPYFFINGKTIRGAYPFSHFQQMIESELTALGQQP